LAKGTNHDDVSHTGNHLSSILYRLATAQLSISSVQVYRVAAKLMDAGLEGQASAGGMLLKNHCQGAIMQWMPSFIALELSLEPG
jgi:hypothetical protein